MEILGRNIPQLQGAISSGFDNVTAGIAETVKAAGVSAIEDTFQIFSTANMGIPADANILAAVANVAEYPDPIAVFTAQSNSSTDPASSSLPLLQTMQNPKFAPEAELSAFTEDKVNEAFKNLAKERPDQLGDLFGYGGPVIDAKLPYVSAADNNLLTMPNKAESESAQARSILKNDSLEDPQSMFWLKKELEVKHKMDALAAKGEAEQWRNLKESLGQVDQLPYVTAADSTAIDSTTATKDAQGAGFSQTADAPAVAAGSETPSATASLEARGIIIVGGKTDGTYFRTIDDSMNDLRNDPQPETVELLQNQVTAVQDMALVSMDAVQLYRQYSDLRASIRG